MTRLGLFAWIEARMKSHICSGTGLTPVPHLRKDWVHPRATSAPGLGSPLPHRHRDWAHCAHICARTALAAARSVRGLGSVLPHLRRDWAHPYHVCTGTGAHPCTTGA
jgi:hypothetical protein